MIAIFEVTKPDKTKRLVIVEDLASNEQANQANENLKRDYPKTKLVSLWSDENVARYTAHEAITERLLLGR